MKIGSACLFLFWKLFNNMTYPYRLLKKLPLLIVCTISVVFTAIAQELSEQDQETFNQGVFHFEKENYQNGLAYFRELIHKYPRDPVFNYFSGVSMTELMIDLETAVRQLNLASVGKVPNNVYYYLGKAHHLRGEFTEATSNYRHFMELGERDEIRELETEKMIGFCQNNVIPKEWENKQDGITLKSPVEQKESIPESEYNRTPTAYDLLVAEALSLQSHADSTRKLADQKRIALRLIRDETEKSSIEQEILELEKKTYDLQHLTDAKHQEIREVESRMAQNRIASDPDAFLPIDRSAYYLGDEMKLDPGTMMGKQLNDEEYLVSLISDLFPDQKEPAFEDLIRINSNAIQTMENAREVEEDINQEILVANSAKNRRDVVRAMDRIKVMEEEALQLKYDAIIQYQKVNDKLYGILENEINRLTGSPTGERRTEIAGLYKNQALQAYDKALEIRDEAKTTIDKEKRYDKVAEANAYELVALENQKRAYATLTGIMPLPDTFAQEEKSVNMNDELVTEDVVEQEMEGEEEPGDKESETFIPSRYTSIEEEYGFELKLPSPYSDGNPVPLDRILPGGVIYRIQVGVFSHMVRHDFFRKLFPVTAEMDLEENFIRYYAGFFKRYAEAENALPLIRKEGYNDAFIVAHFQGGKISLERAKELEELEQKNRETDPDKSEFQSIENPLYRIQFGIFSYPLSEKNLRFYQDKIGNYKIQYLQNIEGEFIYTIGIFLTFEEAEKVREMFVSKGLEGLNTIAFVGNKRIPLR